MTSYGSVSPSASSSKHPTKGSDDSNETTQFLPNGSDDIPSHESASLFSKLVFGWMAPLMRLGNEKKKLDAEDLQLIPLPQDCETEYLTMAFEKCWNEELKGSNPSLIKALFRAFGKDYVVGGFCLKFVHDCAIFVGPQVLHAMIVFLKDADAPLSDGMWLTLAVTFSQLTMSLCLRHYFFKCYKFGLCIRTAVVVAVYKKALILSSGDRHTRSLGEITNLMSVDAQRLQELTTYLHAIWYSFFQIVLALSFLWQQLGPSCLGGVVVIIIMVPVTKTVAKWMGSLQKRLMKAKDQRVEVNSEVLSSMKIIKLQAWEEPFMDRITTLRDAELHQLRQYIVANCFSIMLWSATPIAVALATFAAYVLSGHDLDVSTALTSLALFDLLRFPLFMLPGR
jgi:ABC-type multidrug transport system fused ATPase/permease subunit